MAFSPSSLLSEPLLELEFAGHAGGSGQLLSPDYMELDEDLEAAVSAGRSTPDADPPDHGVGGVPVLNSSLATVAEEDEQAPSPNDAAAPAAGAAAPPTKRPRRGFTPTSTTTRSRRFRRRRRYRGPGGPSNGNVSDT